MLVRFLADAGADIENLHWDGGPVTLDGSASRDRPGGDDASLRYSWRIASAAYGSKLAGEIGSSAVCPFQPDVAGEWTLELCVTNAQGWVASDTVHVRVLSIPTGHSRLFLTVIFADRTGAATPPGTSPIAGDGVERVMIERGTYREAVLFSSANDGAAPTGPVRYVLEPAGVLQFVTPGGPAPSRRIRSSRGRVVPASRRPKIRAQQPLRSRKVAPGKIVW